MQTFWAGLNTAGTAATFTNLGWHFLAANVSFLPSYPIFRSLDDSLAI